MHHVRTPIAEAVCPPGRKEDAVPQPGSLAHPRKSRGGEPGGSGGHYGRGRSVFWTPGSVILGTSGLHKGSEAEPRPHGNGMLETFCFCRRNPSISMSKKKDNFWQGILQKGTDEDLCASYGTRNMYVQWGPFKFDCVTCWFSALHTQRLQWFIFPLKYNRFITGS